MTNPNPLIQRGLQTGNWSIPFAFFEEPTSDEVTSQVLPNTDIDVGSLSDNQRAFLEAYEDTLRRLADANPGRLAVQEAVID